MAVIHELRDDAAHGHAQDVRSLDCQFVQQASRAVCQICEGKRHDGVIRAAIAGGVPGDDHVAIG